MHARRFGKPQDCHRSGQSDRLLSDDRLSPKPMTVNRKRKSATSPEAIIRAIRSEEHTSELQSQFHLVCRLLLEKKKKKQNKNKLTENKRRRSIKETPKQQIHKRKVNPLTKPLQ